ncbi:MAG TPA: hypothetical protein PL009_05390 [Flavipsychrobacter sp.]|nr:hypothetical protein [Flavipsychrobacter sp.]
MKKLLNYAILSVMVLGTAMTSCKKDSNNGGGSVSAGSLTPGQSIVKANISGAHSTSYESTTIMSQATKAGNLIMLTSVKQPALPDLTVDQFIIYLPADIQTGTFKTTDITAAGGGIFTFAHTASAGGTAKGWQADPDGETVFNFTITKATATEIEGTFTGEMSNDNDNTKVSATGSFAGKFQ